jgi:hypothetical protein
LKQWIVNYMLCLRWSPIDFQMWIHQPLVSPSMHYISHWHPKAKLTAAGQHYKIVARNMREVLPTKGDMNWNIVGCPRSPKKIFQHYTTESTVLLDMANLSVIEPNFDRAVPSSSYSKHSIG